MKKRVIEKGTVIHVRKQNQGYTTRYRFTIGREELSQYNLTHAPGFKFTFGYMMNEKDIEKVETAWINKLINGNHIFKKAGL